MTYLLVGGSNCVVHGGYGEVLSSKVSGAWSNRSLGNSPSLRGVDYLLAHPAEVSESERIVFEYALNDLIFESSRTLDSASHELTLRALLAEHAIAARLVFVLMVGQGPSARAAAGQSFVLDHYRALASEYRVPIIDLIPMILSAAGEQGPAAVFKDNDHFTTAMVERLADATATALAALAPQRERAVRPLRGPRLLRVHPLTASSSQGVEESNFRSALLSARMARFDVGGTIELKSPGGLLMGCYARCSRDAGILRLTCGEHDIVKTMRHRFAYDKPFVALRHFSTPLLTRAGDRVVLQEIKGLDAAPEAKLDQTLAQAVDHGGGELIIGDLLFLQTGEESAHYEAVSSPMNLTPRPLHSKPNRSDATHTVGRYDRAPDATGRRLAEGGLRLQGHLKRSEPSRPLVTIVTVCFNAAATVEQTILSVLDQDYGNIEYIIVDGASTDGTVDILRRYEHTIDYFVSEADAGLYHAMNKGLALATGSYVLFLNADDWYEFDTVSSLLRGLLESGADFASALARRIDGNNNAVDVLPPMPFDGSMRFGMPLRHELMLLPAKLYDQIGGYDTTYRIIADFDLAVRLYDAGCTVHEVQRPLLNFRITGVSNTNWVQLVSEHRMLLGRQFAEIDGATLDSLSDPRSFSAELVDAALARHPEAVQFRAALLAYGWRRRLYSAQRPPIELSRLSPIVTVIVPCFNAQATLDRCLRSISDQTLHDLEIICVDDASTDSTPDLLRAWAAADQRIVTIFLAANGGVAKARNAALDRASGEYIAFVDADDELVPSALADLVAAAQKQHSELTRGSYERVEGTSSQRIGDPPDGHPCSGDLRGMPSLLRSTEGFWAYLYRRTFIQNARFRQGLRMGEDSLFLVNALVRARRICWIPAIVVRYHLHASSAMRNFDVGRFEDAIAWRASAWQTLNDYGFKEHAKWLVCEYWGPAYFDGLERNLPHADRERIKDAMRSLLAKAGYRPGSVPGPIGSMLDAIASIRTTTSAPPGQALLRAPMPKGPTRDALIRSLRVGVLSTQDKGGAAIGSVRRVELLRSVGVNATLHTLTTTKPTDYLHPLVPPAQQSQAWAALKKSVIDPVMTLPGYRGRELFSMPRSVLDFTKQAPLFSELNVVHLHWVAGILDYVNVGPMTRGKGVVWTLADMAPFTGGCHYSEGCEEFTRECRDCHLLPPGSDIAHENWKRKRDAYAKIDTLQIICPSRWIGERAARSSLFRGRAINIVPNAFPIDDFQPVNRIVARSKLSLPLNKKLVLFGADSLANRRKGGDLLRSALRQLAESGRATDVHVLVYGHHTLELPLPVHSLGFLNGPEQLSLAYSAADAYAFPSREDNAPLTVAEALLCGTPVVAFPVGNVPELVTSRVNGYVAEYGNTHDFATGLAWALSATPDVRSTIDMRIRCREAAIQHHNATLAIDRHLAVYDEVRRAAGSVIRLDRS